MQSPLIRVIEEFLRETGMSGSRFGLLAVHNSRLVDRLREGGRVWPETEAQIRAFIIARRALAEKDKAA